MTSIRMYRNLLLLLVSLSAGLAIRAEDMQSYLGKIGFTRGTAVKCSTEKYVICAYYRFGDADSCTVGMTKLGNNNGIIEIQLSEIDKKKLLELLKSIEKKKFNLSLDGPTIVLDSDGIEVFIKRGIYALQYEETLSVVKNDREFRAIFKFADAISMR